MTPSHATKGVRRYHYYITHASAITTNEPAWRIGARDIKQAAISLVQQLFENRRSIENMVTMGTSVPHAIEIALRSANEVAALRHSTDITSPIPRRTGNSKTGGAGGRTRTDMYCYGGF